MEEQGAGDVTCTMVCFPLGNRHGLYHIHLMKKVLFLGGWLSAVVGAAEMTVALAPWPGNAKAAWTCTFDDAIRDQFTYAAPRLNEHRLPATFFVMAWTAKSTEEAEAKKPGSIGTITWEEMKQLIKEGHEIGNHSWTHANFRQLPEERLDREIVEAQKRIGERVGVVPTTFCFPFNAITEPSLKRVKATHDAWRTNYRQFGGGMKAKKASIWLDEEEGRSGWTVLMVHGLQNGYDALKDPRQFDLHLQEVARRRDEGRLWPATFQDVSAYITMRESAKVTVEKTGQRQFAVRLTSDLPEEKLIPLTLVIPQAPKTLSATAGGHPLPLVRKGNEAWVTCLPGALELRY